MNLYEKMKDMDIGEMAECITMIVYGSIYAFRGIPHLATTKNIMSEPNYEKTLAKSKQMLLEEQNG